MSNSELIIEERSRDIGDFLVGRFLPFRKKRMVGPFIFIDHMGPSLIGNGNYLDIGQHPHIGLSTLTFLFEGEVEHRDTTGTIQRVRPGEVNIMTAGKGVTHTERTPQDLRSGATHTLHGFQIWLALSEEKEDMDPEFHHFEAGQLPSWREGELDFLLVAGEGYGHSFPLPNHDDLFMLEIKSSGTDQLNTHDHLKGEIGICVVKGAIEACGNTIEAGNMLVSKIDDTCTITLKDQTHLLLFGGKPLPEERFIHWNFVSTSKEKIEAAKQGWVNKEFPMLEDDDSYIPLP